MGLSDLKKNLESQESQEFAGSVVMAPKQQLLDARDVEAAHPTKRIRWLNLQNPDKVLARQTEGYVRLSEEEGGRSLGGSMALFAIPRGAYEAKLRAQKAENKRRLSIHKQEWENIADGIARTLRDRHGYNIEPEDLIKE